MKSFKDLTKEEIIQAIQEADYLTTVCEILDIHKNSNNRNKLRSFISEYNIDCSHFKTIMTKDKYYQSPKYCKNCGKEIPYENRENDFCDHSCSASYNNRKRNQNQQEKIETYEKVVEKKHCLYCGAILSNTQKKYCNQKCQSEHRYQQWVQKWKNGEETGLSGEYGISHQLRRYLLNKFDHKCSRCGWNEVNPYTGNIPLEIEHIDGNYKNNSEDNLTVLCPNCHSLTATYKGANRGHGRKERSKYYNEYGK